MEEMHHVLNRLVNVLVVDEISQDFDVQVMMFEVVASLSFAIAHFPRWQFFLLARV